MWLRKLSSKSSSSISDLDRFTKSSEEPYIGVNLKGADLRASNLKGTILVDAYLEFADLSEAHLEGANLTGAHLEGTAFRDAYLQDARLEASHLQGASFVDSKLQGANFSSADLRAVDLSGTTLKGVNFSNSKFGGTILSEANLTDAKNLTKESLKETYLCATKLPNDLKDLSNRNCKENDWEWQDKWLKAHPEIDPKRVAKYYYAV